MLLRLSLALALLLGIAWSQSPPLLLKPADVLTVTVFGHKDYSGDYTVQSDGAIYATGAGRVIASGKTVDQVERTLRERFGKLILRPDLSVVLKTERKLVIYVVGDGRQGMDKGVVAYDSTVDLRKVLAETAPQIETDLLTVSVFRNGVVIQNVDPAKLLGNSSTEWDGPLLPDDVVVINPSPFIRVWVLGSVRKPGEIRLRDGGDVYRAIAEAGDLNMSLTSAAEPGQFSPRMIREDFRVTIRRGPDTISVPPSPKAGDPPVVLQAGDTVYVEEKGQMRVTVLGEVKRPGEQILASGGTLAVAVTEAGGATEIGSLRNVQLYRHGEVTTIDAIGPNGELSASSTPLEPGDMILVPQNRRTFYVFGEVNHPGRKLIDDRRPLHLADALSSADGLSPRGTYRRIVVLRPDKAGKLIPHQYNFDEYAKHGDLSANPEILPGDVVYVSTPRGLNFTSIVEIASAALIIEGAKQGLP